MELKTQLLGKTKILTKEATVNSQIHTLVYQPFKTVNHIILTYTPNNVNEFSQILPIKKAESFLLTSPKRLKYINIPSPVHPKYHNEHPP